MSQPTDDAVAADSADRVLNFEKIKTRLLPALPGVTAESYNAYIEYRSFLGDHDVRTVGDGRLGGYLPFAVGKDGEDLVLGMLAGVGMPQSYLDHIVEDFKAMEILFSGVEIIEAYLHLSDLLTEQDRRGWKDLQEVLLGRRRPRTADGSPGGPTRGSDVLLSVGATCSGASSTVGPGAPEQACSGEQEADPLARAQGEAGRGRAKT